MADKEESADIFDSTILATRSSGITSTLLSTRTATSTSSLWPNLGLSTNIVIDTSFIPTQSPLCSCEGLAWSDSKWPGAPVNEGLSDFSPLETAVPYGKFELLHDVSLG